MKSTAGRFSSRLGRRARASFIARTIGCAANARAGRPSHVALAVALMLFAFIGAAPTETTETSLVPAPATQSIRFATVDVRIDPQNHPLAAYQVEVTAGSPNVKLAGVEGGDHAAFREPPYYDPAALSRNRIILASFNTGSDLPNAHVRVARLHVQIAGDENDNPKWEVKLAVASASDGSAIPGATAAASTSSSPASSAPSSAAEGAAP